MKKQDDKTSLTYFYIFVFLLLLGLALMKNTKAEESNQDPTVSFTCFNEKAPGYSWSTLGHFKTHRAQVTIASPQGSTSGPANFSGRRFNDHTIFRFDYVMMNNGYYRFSTFVDPVSNTAVIYDYSNYEKTHKGKPILLMKCAVFF